jgi:DMSO/TMAO reductase YedYZ molybdopterin-dependent catalytic subunit
MALSPRNHILTLLIVASVAGLMASLLPGANAGGHPAAAATTPEASPVLATSVEILGLVERLGALTFDDLRRLPNQSVQVTYESSTGPERHDFTGVLLYDVLQYVGVVADPGDRTPLLRRYLIVSAHDGYRIVVSGAELDPNFGNVPMLLAWERDGQPLTGEEGPVQLVVPGDSLISRYVYGVARIEVLGIESALEVAG